MRHIFLGFIAALLFSSEATALTMRVIEVAPDGTVTNREYDIPDNLAAQHIAGIAQPSYLAKNGNGVTRYLNIGLTDNAGNIFTLGPNGEVYRNGLRLMNGAVKMSADPLVKFGNEIFAKGLTSGVWYRWTGNATTNSWTTVPPDFDPNILK